MTDSGGPGDALRERLVGIVPILVLGLGLLDLFTNIVPGIPFWVIFVIGFAVVVPLAAIVLGVEDESEETEDPVDRPVDRTDRALAELRERYARGELTDEQFERKLDRLLDTDSVENAEDYRKELEEA